MDISIFFKFLALSAQNIFMESMCELNEQLSELIAKNTYCNTMDHFII